jgi:hypothetical protein
MLDANSELMNALRPIVLVIVLRDYDLGHAGSGRGSRGTGAAMVDNPRHTFEQSLVVDIVDD